MSRFFRHFLRLPLTSVILAVVSVSGISSVSCRNTREERKGAAVRVFKQVSPAVVSIRAVPDPGSYRNPFYHFPAKPSLRDFFRDFGIETGVDREPDLNLGSGVIIDPEGYVLTNEHVVINSAAVVVRLEDGKEYEAEVIGSDARSDLAVLKIKAQTDLPHLKMGRSDDLMIGEEVIAIGNPFGLGHTLTTGVISSLHRPLHLGDRVYTDLIQTDASINPGNSGGPLLNVKGELIGITTAIFHKARGIGFAIPIDRARRIVHDLIKYGEVQPGWIGITVRELTPELRNSLNYDSREGVLISRVHEAGPAKDAGIEAGQILQGIEDAPVNNIKGFLDAIRDVTINDRVSLSIFKRGGSRQIKVTASAFPLSLADELIWNQAGIKVSEGRGSRGAMISRVNPRSRAGRIGISAGDIILKVNQYWIKSPEQFKLIMVKNRQMESVLFGIQRGNVIYYTTVPLNFVG